MILLISVFAATPSRADFFFSSDAEKIKFLESAKHVSMVFATENPRSPVSSFGHSFLVFHNDADPEPSALALEFFGDYKATAFLARSVFGTVPGGFALTEFHRKSDDSNLEDRDLLIAHLTLSEFEKKKMLVELLKELQGERPYNFFFLNCSNYVYSLVNNATENQCGRALFITPLESVLRLSRCGRVSSFSTMTSDFHKIEIYRRDHPGLAEKGLSADKLRAKMNIEALELSPSRRIEYQLELNYLMPRTPQEFQRVNMMEWKSRLHFADEQTTVDADVYASSARSEIQPRAHRLSGLSAGYDSTNSDAILSIFPGYRLFESSQPTRFWSDELIFFRPRFNLNKDRALVRDFTVFDLDSRQGGSLGEPGFTRKFSIGYSDWSTPNAEYKESEVRVGSGWTFAPLTSDLKATLLFSGSGGQFQTGDRSGWGLAASTEVAIDVGFSESVRVSGRFEHYLGTHAFKLNRSSLRVSLIDLGRFNISWQESMIDAFRRRRSEAVVTCFF